MWKRLLPPMMGRWLSAKKSRAADAARFDAPAANRSSSHAGERGSNLIEMAFVMMVILALLGGVVDFGSAFEQYIVITNAAREGARRYAILPCKADNRVGLTEAVEDTVLVEVAGAIQDAVISEPGGSGIVLTSGNVTMTPDPRSGCPAAGSPVVVTVEIDYIPRFANIAGIDTMRLRAEASMVYQGTD